MTKLKIVHLVDDTTPGGVMRVVDHILTASELGRDADHSLHRAERGSFLASTIEADLIVSHLSLSWRGLPYLTALRALHADIPLVHVEHSYTEGFAALNVPHKRRFHTLLRVAYALFDRVVAVSRTQGNWLIERGLIEPSGLQVITSCVDLSHFRALPAPRTRRVIGAIGRLHPQKGFDTLIHAFRALPGKDLELQVHGDGPDRDKLRDLSTGDPRIRFIGHGGDPAAIMARTDIVAMPSRWEAYGLVALEARAAHRPLIVSNIDGLRDHIAAGATAARGFSVSDWTSDLRDAITSTDRTTPVGTPEAEEQNFLDSWKRLVADLVTPDERRPRKVRKSLMTAV